MAQPAILIEMCFELNARIVLMGGHLSWMVRSCPATEASLRHSYRRIIIPCAAVQDNWPYQPVPKQVASPALEGRKVAAIACGENHSLVATTEGELLAWGSLHLGRCGFKDSTGLPTDDQDRPYQPVPRRVNGGALEGKRVVFVACGTFHSLAVTGGGELYSWGSAVAGRCGFADVRGLPVDPEGMAYQPVPRQAPESAGCGLRKILGFLCARSADPLFFWGRSRQPARSLGEP